MFTSNLNKASMNLRAIKSRAKLQCCVTLLWGPILALLAASRLPASEAFCNCFTPGMSMFKMGKQGGGGGGLSPYASSIYANPQQVVHPGERASWYAQSQQQQLAALPTAYGQQNLMKRLNLFQPKWRGSLFGPKKWSMMDWRMMNPNANFYRPGYGYGYGANSLWSPNVQPQIPNPPLSQLLPAGGYSSSLYPPLSSDGRGQLQQQQQQLYPGGAQQGTRGPASGGGSYSPQLNTNDGWSAVPTATNLKLPPYNSQQAQLLNTYGDTYGVVPQNPFGNLIQPSRQQQQQQQQQSSGINNYGTKGASGTKQPYATTRKSVLMADGGYNLFDAHLGDGKNGSLYNNSTLQSTPSGYTYPEWYSGVIDSPIKIAQQLYKTQKYRDTVTGGILL